MYRSELTHTFVSSLTARLALAEALHELAKRNVLHIDLEYLKKRLARYNTLLIARDDTGSIAAFMCAHIDEVQTPIPFFRLPLLHFGLSVVDQPYRAQQLARRMPEILIGSLVRRFAIRFFIFGILLSAKCSSPASFQTIEKATEPIFWPKLVTAVQTGAEPTVPALLRWLIPALRSTLGLTRSHSLVLQAANADGAFRLAGETYSKTIRPETRAYFATAMLPTNSELISFGLWHPMHHFAKRLH